MIALENMQAQQVTGTHDWTQYSITLPIHPQAQQIYFGVLVSGTGTLWADDLELLVDGKPIAEASAMPPRPALARRADNYSYFNAAIGSTREARSAGI